MGADKNSISYFEFGTGEKGFLFFKENGHSAGYRVRFAEQRPISAEKLKVTNYATSGDVHLAKFIDNDGAAVTMSALGDDAPQVSIDGKPSTIRYVNASDDPKVPNLLKEIQDGKIRIIDRDKPDPAGGPHNRKLSKLLSAYTDNQGNGYALLSERETGPIDGTPIELAKITLDGKVNYYAGTASNAGRSGYSLETALGGFKSTLFIGSLDDMSLKRASPLELRTIQNALGLSPESNQKLKPQ